MHACDAITTRGGGGGGGGTRLSNGRGVPLGGWKPDPVLNRSAHEKYSFTLSYYTLQKMFICIPCFNIAHLGYIPCPIVAYSKRNEKLDSNIERKRTFNWTYSNTNSINMIFIIIINSWGADQITRPYR